MRALAIKKLREHDLLLPEIKRKLAGVPIEELAREVLPPELPANAGEHAGTAEIHRAWRRVELMRGLELHASADAGAVARRMAAEIREEYGCERD